MFRPPDHNTRLIARAAPGNWAAALGDLHNPQCLKDHPKGTVYRATLLGRDCIIKCSPIASPKRRLQTLLRQTPAQKHWKNALWLRAHNIPTAPPLAILRGTHDTTPVECLVLAFLPGSTVLDHLAADDLSTAEQHRVAETLATIACRLATLGVRNRDPKPSNLIVTNVTPERAELAVIDCADLRHTRKTIEHAVARMLAAAYIEPLGCGIPPRRALCARAIRTAAAALHPHHPHHPHHPDHPDHPHHPTAAAQQLWKHTAAIVSTHRNPTPAHNPLTPASPTRSS
ncbi:MAG: hypothetical protein Q9O74_02480 [Planctomycetota bacterium]|nr:hypothetical protein [Planctomycetota bacterium]